MQFHLIQIEGGLSKATSAPISFNFVDEIRNADNLNVGTFHEILRKWLTKPKAIATFILKTLSNQENLAVFCFQFKLNYAKVFQTSNVILYHSFFFFMKRSWVEFCSFVVCFLPSELSKHFPSVSLFSLIFSVGFSFYFLFLLSLNPLSLSFSQDLLLFLILFFFLMFWDFSFRISFCLIFLTFCIYFLLFLLVFFNFYTDLIFAVSSFFML